MLASPDVGRDSSIGRPPATGSLDPIGGRDKQVAAGRRGVEAAAAVRRRKARARQEKADRAGLPVPSLQRSTPDAGVGPFPGGVPRFVIPAAPPVCDGAGHQRRCGGRPWRPGTSAWNQYITRNTRAPFNGNLSASEADG